MEKIKEQNINEVVTKLIMEEENILLKAIILINEIFLDKYDKEGVPYVNHLYYVCDNLKTTKEKVVGLLHDSIEDTKLTYSDLKKFGFPQDIIKSIRILTRDKRVDYSTYIDNILKSRDMVAIKVKQVDMKHNMNKERLAHLEQIERERLMAKYSPEYEKIEKYLKER